jgi:hypothetical protein
MPSVLSRGLRSTQKGTVLVGDPAFLVGDLGDLPILPVHWLTLTPVSTCSPVGLNSSTMGSTRLATHVLAGAVKGQPLRIAEEIEVEELHQFPALSYRGRSGWI